MNGPAHKTSRSSPRVGWTSICCLLVCLVAFWPGELGICPPGGWPVYGCAAGVCSSAAAEPAAAVATNNAPADKTQQPIDFDRARQLIQKRQRGQALSAEEEAYVRRAIEARRAEPQPSGTGRQKVVRMLLDFFTSDPLARPWFAKPQQQ